MTTTPKKYCSKWRARFYTWTLKKRASQTQLQSWDASLKRIEQPLRPLLLTVLFDDQRSSTRRDREMAHACASGHVHAMSTAHPVETIGRSQESIDRVSKIL